MLEAVNLKTNDNLQALRYISTLNAIRIQTGKNLCTL